MVANQDSDSNLKQAALYPSLGRAAGEEEGEYETIPTADSLLGDDGSAGGESVVATASVLDPHNSADAGEPGFEAGFDRDGDAPAPTQEQLDEGAVCLGGALGFAAGCIVGCPVVLGIVGGVYAAKAKSMGGVHEERHSKLAENGARYIRKAKQVNEDHHVLTRAKAAVVTGAGMAARAARCLYKKFNGETSTAHAASSGSGTLPAVSPAYVPPAAVPAKTVPAL